MSDTLARATIVMQGAIIACLLTMLTRQHQRIEWLEKDVMSVRMELAVSHFRDKLPKEGD